MLISCAGTEIKTKRSYPCVRLELKFETCEREYTAGPGLKDGKKRASVLSPGGVISLSQTISVEIVSKIRNFGRLELKFETRKRRNGEKERANSIFGSAGVTKNEFKRVYFSIVSLSASTFTIARPYTFVVEVFKVARTIYKFRERLATSEKIGKVREDISKKQFFLPRWATPEKRLAKSEER